MDELLREHLLKLYEKHPFIKDNGARSSMTDRLIAEDFYILGYNKAVDEFSEKLKAIVEKDLADPNLMLQCKQCGIWKVKDIEEIVTQMKI